MQGATLSIEKFDDREPNRVGASRRPGRKHSMWPVVDGGRAEQLESFGSIKDPHNEQVRKAFNVSEAGFELRKNLESALCVMLGAKSLGISGVF